MSKASAYERDWARRGAFARLQEIERERTDILAAFPDLRRGRPGGWSGPVSRPKRKISAAARRAMSDGMRKYWARRKAQSK